PETSHAAFPSVSSRSSFLPDQLPHFQSTNPEDKSFRMPPFDLIPPTNLVVRTFEPVNLPPTITRPVKSNCESNSDVNTAIGHPYPLRSRLRRESMRRQWQAAQSAPKSFSQLPTEILFRIAHYLNIQDVFRLQMVDRRLKAIVERYLLLVKRINFSNGLPFAFLPESITDLALKRILSRTPEVTHILGFYPRRIAGSYPADCHSLGNNRSAPTDTLTYAGIVSAFRICPRLRSVELMDVELMSKLVHYLPRIKFHGMFRNRPDSWDCEYAVPLPSEENSSLEVNPLAEPSTPRSSSCVDASPYPRSSDSSAAACSVSKQILGCYLNTLFCSAAASAAMMEPHQAKVKPHKTLNEANLGRLINRCLPLSPLSSAPCSAKSPNKHQSTLPYAAVVLAEKHATNYANLSTWFDPLGESPVGYGSPSTVPHFLPPRPSALVNGLLQWQDRQPQQGSIAASGSLGSVRNIAVTPFFQPRLPPIEAELINAHPLIQSHVNGSSQPAAPSSPNNYIPLMALAFGAILSPHLLAQAIAVPILLAPPGIGAAGFLLATQALEDRRLFGPQQYAHAHFPVAVQFQQGPAARAPEPPQPAAGRVPFGPVHPIAAARVARRPQMRQYIRSMPITDGRSNTYGPPWFVSPLPSLSNWIGLPHAITNLTKLDLVSVSVSAIPRLDNIKYLHLKWVVFASADPFFNFSATKLQSFVMNNCSGPSRVVRFVRIFSALARAPQLSRLELVGIRFVDGLLAHIIDVPLLPSRGFRNLQRLVLSSNKEATEFDMGLLLLAGQLSLNHVAIQIAHTRNSLFESLMCAQASFPRLENLILGYQDPYQSRLTVSELLSLGLGESSDHLTPLCGITDWGLSVVFHLCPRLASLTIRHAPYLSSLNVWHDRSLARPSDGVSPQDQPVSAQSNLNEVDPADEDTSTDNQTPTNAVTCPVDPLSLSLRSLTLENCPSISIQSLEDAISTGDPFPCLETLVLRDMFVQRSETSSRLLMRPTWSERMARRTNAVANAHDSCVRGSELNNVDWCRIGHLQALSDLLTSQRLGFSSICSEGVGLASSVREVVPSTAHPGLRGPDVSMRPFDLFFSLRMHHYLNSLLELDGSCGPLSYGHNRIASLLASRTDSSIQHVSTGSQLRRRLSSDNETDFVSQSTQTCVCGLLEWHMFKNISISSTQPPPQRGSCKSKLHASSTTQTELTLESYSIVPSISRLSQEPSNSVDAIDEYASGLSVNRTSSSSSAEPQKQLGGPLAFHPFPPSGQHQDLYRIIASSKWTNRLLGHSAFTSLSSSKSPYVSTDSGECPGCAFTSSPHQPMSSQAISCTRLETGLQHRPRKWIARDATVDTSELRCHTSPGLLVLTIFQPPDSAFSNLTSIHFENLGLSHVVLSGAPHLKNITLENCAQLQAVLFSHANASLPTDGADSFPVDSVPCLRRVRVIRCPKFAIYYLLHTIACLYPAHDENISITYRPFGHYNKSVERALWSRAHHAHVLVSHDYKQFESEREMEEFHSTFDQLFREVINFAE
ncbi:F-box protein 38, partial [Paragonimus skrjabini miyazakii]